MLIRIHEQRCTDLLPAVCQRSVRMSHRFPVPHGDGGRILEPSVRGGTRLLRYGGGSSPMGITCSAGTYLISSMRQSFSKVLRHINRCIHAITEKDRVISRWPVRLCDRQGNRCQDSRFDNAYLVAFACVQVIDDVVSWPWIIRMVEHTY